MVKLQQECNKRVITLQTFNASTHTAAFLLFLIHVVLPSFLIVRTIDFLLTSTTLTIRTQLKAYVAGANIASIGIGAYLTALSKHQAALVDV